MVPRAVCLLAAPRSRMRMVPSAIAFSAAPQSRRRTRLRPTEPSATPPNKRRTARAPATFSQALPQPLCPTVLSVLDLASALPRVASSAPPSRRRMKPAQAVSSAARASEIQTALALAASLRAPLWCKLLTILLVLGSASELAPAAFSVEPQRRRLRAMRPTTLLAVLPSRERTKLAPAVCSAASPSTRLTAVGLAASSAALPRRRRRVLGPAASSRAQPQALLPTTLSVPDSASSAALLSRRTTQGPAFSVWA
mmetsp:Transcript_98513/g.278574  ORF Transcript_98513/g.278574 Transcript_98513/m.278574 type:complete len:254 (+) Transcript_98513:689-1450(+)